MPSCAEIEGLGSTNKKLSLYFVVHLMEPHVGRAEQKLV